MFSSGYVRARFAAAKLERTGTSWGLLRTRRSLGSKARLLARVSSLVSATVRQSSCRLHQQGVLCFLTSYYQRVCVVLCCYSLNTLDDELSVSTGLFHLGNRNRRPRATRSGRLYIGSRGEINPVDTSIHRLTYM